MKSVSFPQEPETMPRPKSSCPRDPKTKWWLLTKSPARNRKKLYALLVEKFGIGSAFVEYDPFYRTLSKPLLRSKLLADELGVSHEAFYKWCRRDKLPIERANQFVEFWPTKFVLVDFLDFL